MIRCLMVDDDRYYSFSKIEGESIISLKGVSVEDVVVVRNYWEAMKWVNENGIPEILTMDNDIASFDTQGQEYKGYDFVKWLCGEVMDEKCVFPDNFKFNAHTANIVDQKAMINYLTNFFDKVLNKKLTLWV